MYAVEKPMTEPGTFLVWHAILMVFGTLVLAAIFLTAAWQGINNERLDSAMNTIVDKVAEMSVSDLEALPLDQIQELSEQTNLAVLPDARSDKAIAIPTNTKIMLVLRAKIEK